MARRTDLGRNTKALLMATLGVALTAAPVLARSASTMQDLVGSRAGQAERTVQDRGFTYVSNRNHNGGVQAYWWHDRDDNCIRIQTIDGRYTDIRDVSSSDCGHSSSGSTVGTAAAVGVGALILGALIAGSDDDHRSHHHSDGAHSNDMNYEQQYELGYRAGLYNTAYHNTARSDAYSSGYTAGVQQRENQTRHTSGHRGAGGYQESVYVGDLQGARANALDGLSERGFRQVDNFTSGDTRYAIWWNRNTRQCLQATVADGRVYDISDIGTHPNCR